MKSHMIRTYEGLKSWDKKQKELCKKSLKLWDHSKQATIKSVRFTKQIIFQLIRNNLKIGAFTTILKKIPTISYINSESQSFQKIIHKEFIPIFLRFSINEAVNEVTEKDIEEAGTSWERPDLEDQCIKGSDLNYWYGGVYIYPRPKYSTKLDNVYNGIETIPGDNLELYTAYKEYIFKGDMDVKFYKVKDTSIDTDNDSNQFLVITKEPYESNAFIEKTSLFGIKKKATKLQVLKEYTEEEPVEIIKELIKTSVEEDPSDELINTYYYKYLILYKLNLIETCILFENKKENDLFFFDESQKNNIEYDLQDENYFFNYNFIIYKNNLCKKPELFNKIIKKSLDYCNKLRDKRKAEVKQEKKASKPETVNKHNLDIWEGEEVTGAFNAGGALKTVKRKRKIKVKSRTKPNLAVNSKIKGKAKGKTKRHAKSSVKRKKSKF